MKATSTRLAIFLLVLGLVSTPAHAGAATSVSSAADQAARQMAEAFKPLWGTVLSALPDHRFVLDVATDNGVYVGMEMQVFREGEPFKHPVTGKVLGRMDKQIGVVRVVEVKEQFSVAEKISLEKGEQIGQGDGVRVTAARLLVGLANVSSSVIAEGQVRVLSREIETALHKTGRFEVMDERMMRSTLEKEQVADTVLVTDPQALTILRSILRLHAVIVPIVRAVEQGWEVDLKAVSTFSSRPLYLASADVRTATAAPTATTAPAPTAPQPAAREPQLGPPAPTTAPAPTVPQPAPREPQLGPPAPPPPTVASNADPQGNSAPAWIGPPQAEEGKRSSLNPHFMQNARFQKFDPKSGSKNWTYRIQPMPVGAIAIAFGDLNGNGQDEMVVISRNEIFIFRWNGTYFRLSKKLEGTRIDNYIAVDVADINGNGRAEIFVTNIDSRKASSADWMVLLRSFVLELKKEEEELVRLWDGVGLYFRVLKSPEHPEGLLLTQTVGRYTPFVDPILRYVWDGTTYVADRSMTFPTAMEVYGFTLVDMNDDGTDDYVVMGWDGFVRVWNEDGKRGKKIAETREEFGVFNHITFTQVGREAPELVRDDHHIEDRAKAGTRTIPRRLVVTDLGPNGSPGILVGANYQSGGLGAISEVFRRTEGSAVVHLTWDGTGLKKQWSSEGNRNTYLADYGIAKVGGGQVLAMLNLEKRFLRSTQGSLEIFRVQRAGATAVAGPAPTPTETTAER